MHMGSFFGLLFGGIGSEMLDAAGFRDSLSLWYVPLHHLTRQVYLRVGNIKRYIGPISLCQVYLGTQRHTPDILASECHLENTA